MAKKSKDQASVIEVNEIEMKEIVFNVLGSAPLIMNRFSQKAWQELLMPTARQSRATLESKLKHDPTAEFRGALYRTRDPNAPALIHVPNGAFHGALAQAGVDMPGAAKAKLERLTSIVDTNICLYGVPHLFMSMVRNSDMNKTPDVRTRPIFPEWACTVTIRYTTPQITQRTVANLFGAAGVIVGVGDWRPQKGGSYGTWQCVSDSDAKFKSIVKKQGRAAQQAAYDEPICYDADTEELMAWFTAELARRERGDDHDDDVKPSRKRKPELQVVTENGSGDVVQE